MVHVLVMIMMPEVAHITSVSPTPRNESEVSVTRACVMGLNDSITFDEADLLPMKKPLDHMGTSSEVKE